MLISFPVRLLSAFLWASDSVAVASLAASVSLSYVCIKKDDIRI